MKTQALKTQKSHGQTPALDRQPEALRDLVRQIVETARPLRVILFGSRARGDARPDSDYDFLIIMPAGTHRRHTAQKLYREVQGFKVPFDVVVATPEDLEKYKDNCALVYRWALREGREIYVS